jgi:hypothetical protein
VPAAACGHKNNQQNAAGDVQLPSAAQPATPYGQPAATVDSTQTTPKHHSKLKGAAAGAVAGHMVGHGVVGAAAGAIYQHERNKQNKHKK